MGEIAAILVCACEDDGDDQCINGTVYSYCTSDLCGGACSPAGLCSCPLHSLIDHDTVYAAPGVYRDAGDWRIRRWEA